MVPKDRASRGRTPDGIGCAGILLLMLLLGFATGMLVNPQPAASETGAAAAVGGVPTLARPAQALAAYTAAPTLTSSPSPTSTNTRVPTATPTPTQTPSPTSTPSPTATPTNTLLPAVAPAAVTPWPWPLPTPVGNYSFTVKVPILMYHYISDTPPDADRYRVGLSVSPAAFQAQMAYLAAAGFTPIDFYTLAAAIAGRTELPDRPVLITIDDGYRDAYVHAFPILRHYGFTATVFVITDFVDQGHPAYLTWDMIREMNAAGIRLEPHTKTHQELDNRDRDFLIYQILGSQETLAYHLGYTPRFFAYPAGRYDDQVVAILRELDFWGAVTTAVGKWHGFNDRFEWTRLRVRNNTYLPEFADAVDPGEARHGKPPGIAPTPTLAPTATSTVPTGPFPRP